VGLGVPGLELEAAACVDEQLEQGPSAIPHCASRPLRGRLEPSGRVVIGMTIFDDPAYRDAFEKFRRMPDEVFEMYFACLRRPDLTTGQVLDVGAGPGIQTEMLLSRLPPGWRAVALEPSVEMGASALARLSKFGCRVSLLGCRFEELSIRGAFDVVWMSEVVHLLGEVPGWTGRSAAVIRPGGRVLIRTSTHAQLRDRYWYRFLPSALQIDLARHPTKGSVLRGLAEAGFAQISAVTIYESRWISAQLLLAMMRERAFSTLYHLSKADLEKGLQLLRSDLDGRPGTKWHYEMTAYTATFLGGAPLL